MEEDIIIIGARRSPLSSAQVQEVIKEIHGTHPEIIFTTRLLDTFGDLNLQISLRSLDKTDFFTREIDSMLLKSQCRIAIHSAKDLPEPIPKGLTLVALTKGKDPADCLVMRPGDTLETLPPGAKIATSSARREATVRDMRPDLHFIDIRGDIIQRLSKLETREADGVVIAEAALIRLRLKHLNRLKLPGETAKHQGQLAVVAREDDGEMAALFSCIDTRMTGRP